MTPQHNKKADHSSDRPAYMIEFKLCLTHASVGYSSSKNVVLRIPFQNIRPSEDSLFCCFGAEDETLRLQHNSLSII